MPGKVTYSREPPLTDPAALFSCIVQLDKLDMEGDPSDIVEKVRLIVKGIDGNPPPDLDNLDMGGCTALHQCAKQRPNEFGANKGKLAVAKILLDAGASVQKTDKFGATPLHMACMSSDPEGGLFSTLIEAGADPTAIEPMFENTPLHWACQSGLPRVLEPIFSAPNVREALAMTNKDGKTPIEVAKAGANKAPYPFKSSAELVRMIEAFNKKK